MCWMCDHPDATTDDYLGLLREKMRKRGWYERQGILAEADAIEHAEQRCLSDAEIRARHRERDQLRRAGEDQRFQAEFAVAVHEQFPGCPASQAEAIARHAATRGSGRIRRSTAGRALDADAVRLAVITTDSRLTNSYPQAQLPQPRSGANAKSRNPLRGLRPPGNPAARRLAPDRRRCGARRHFGSCR